MIFIHQTKASGELQAFGSITSIAEHTEIKVDKLYYHFTRKKKTVYEDDLVYIKKTEIIRSKRVLS